MAQGYIDSFGRYHKNGIPKKLDGISSQYKSYSHDRQRAEHAADLVQPWVNGKFNPEFRDLYPKESKENYGQH